MGNNLPNRVKSVNAPSVSSQGICDRLIQIRKLRYGTRGKSAFARDLEVPITTYVHYEAGRMPPVDFLVKAAAVANVRLEWLILGEEPQELQPSSTEPARLALPTLPDHAELIPLVGNTSAGMAHYWNELNSTIGPAADQQLERLLTRCKENSSLTSTSWEPDETLQPPTSQTSDTVALIQYAEPDSDGILEFVSAPSLKERYPDAVAWRIDGESMAPRYTTGDIVITSLSTPAVDDHPCVCRQRNQIGVNCKLYRREGEQISLIPINPKSNRQKVAKKEILWALRVVSSVKLAK